MSKFDVVITVPAENDLQQIAYYITVELRDPTGAQQVITRIAEAIIELGNMPLRYPLVSDEGLAHKGIRKMTVNKYIVFYVVSETRQIVTVIRILYGKRNWNYLL